MISCGSEWHRWEPHIHAPGTVLNNQFGSSDPWDAYLTTLEALTPTIESIAVTDYYVTDTYEEFLTHKAAGRLPSVILLFPNIELRLDVAAKSGFVNVHLLVSPEDPEHLIEVKRILKRLQFQAFNDRFDCTREELIKLGKRADQTITDDGAALRHGATQFKVNFDQLRKVIGESEWAKKNILIAVAGSAGDGTSGVRQAADTTVRQEIEKFAHIIFSSSPAQREFWLGQRIVTIEELRSRYDGVDIRKLSPSTRGIVLLLLYLALDDADDRPLIIDQPEENLDPKSVFDELVALFIAAKGKRQVIIVTHNANLVINTDADQIIVAEAGPHSSGGLPSSLRRHAIAEPRISEINRCNTAITPSSIGHIDRSLPVFDS